MIGTSAVIVVDEVRGAEPDVMGDRDRIVSRAVDVSDHNIFHTTMASTEEQKEQTPQTNTPGDESKIAAAKIALKVHDEAVGPGAVVTTPHPITTPPPPPDATPSEPDRPPTPPVHQTYEPPVDGKINEVPIYAIVYAPLLHCYDKERYWPGSVLVHLEHCHPETYDGDLIDIPRDVVGKPAMLTLPQVNKDDVFLKLDVEPKEEPDIDYLTSRVGIPNLSTGKSVAPAWMLVIDKTKELGPGIVDVFYFFFWPFNFGPTVMGKHFGNHVGDWEHAMIRFRSGVPYAMHLSSHSDGEAYEWSALEKRGIRPVIYPAEGSHALYPKPGTHNYSGVPLGPSDHTSRGPIWDPTLNYVAASFDLENNLFMHLPSTAPPSPDISPADVVSILAFKGKWGNSFSKIRKLKEHALRVDQKLVGLVWAQGCSGPCDKSLDRKGMNRWGERKLFASV
ncbi:hypothetical protein BOTBODRAFT_38910 [Botryobasidium botryosum FD-172 SS1]|uniref:Vacuolar protein sorting-associated protein 62 n=1 Tax=Botryobasidium botryosum (strain FD-172 SS1) TaxID=930990 RepID=A0A067LVD5_BOTB1|nr:hypothetical protein BOTBODRAFT_38910 [Botryobasidium botryosum FD-172 SS1]